MFVVFKFSLPFSARLVRLTQAMPIVGVSRTAVDLTSNRCRITVIAG